MISTGKKIYDILSVNAGVTALVGDRIYALVAPEDTQLPCIVYDRAFQNQLSKDSSGSTNSTINVLIASDKYLDGIDIAEACFSALRTQAKLMSGTEAYENGAYLQVLVFSFWDVV